MNGAVRAAAALATIAAGAVAPMAMAEPPRGAADAPDAPPRTPPAALFTSSAPTGVIVRFRAGTTSAARASALRRAGAGGATPVAGFPRTMVTEADGGSSPRAVARRLAAQPGVAWAEPDGVMTASAIPSDPYFGNLWGLRNTGQAIEGWAGPFSGTPGVDIGAPTAWDVTAASTDVTVGVVDSGVDATHPDLAGNLRAGPGSEIDATDGGTSGWSDPDGHGTHVAGTIAARGDNALGVTGVNWRASLVSARVLDQFGSGTSTSVAMGLLWAGSHARVVNASLGGSVASNIVEQAIRTNPGTLYVVSAGNDGRDVDAHPVYPCVLPLANVLCVAALAPDGSLPGWSNFGSTAVHLAAPGQEIQSTAAGPIDVGSATADPTWPVSPAGSWVAGLTTDADPVPMMRADGAVGAGVARTLVVPGVQAFAGTACRMRARLGLNIIDGDRLAVQVQEGGTWTTAATIDGPITTNGAYEYFPVPLGNYDGRAVTGLRFSLTSVHNGAFQSDITSAPFAAVRRVITECTAPQPPGGSYAFDDGTSMAAPFVTGTAALVLATNPALTAVQAKDIILRTVTPAPGLLGRVATGGRLNAAAAVRAAASTIAAPPAPPAPAMLTLRGTGAIRATLGTVRLPVACDGGAGTRCAARVTLRQRTMQQGRARWVALGRRDIDVVAGWRGIAVVPLTRSARRTVSRHARVRAQAGIGPIPPAPGDTRRWTVRIRRG